jgi:hypothetical protein
LYLERGLTWEAIREMTLDEVDLQVLLLDRLAAARRPAQSQETLSEALAAAGSEGV